MDIESFLVDSVVQFYFKKHKRPAWFMILTAQSKKKIATLGTFFAQFQHRRQKKL